MRNAAVGLQRVIARLRPDRDRRPVTGAQRITPTGHHSPPATCRDTSASRARRTRANAGAGRSTRTTSAVRPALLAQLAGERLVSVTAVSLVAAALVVSTLGSTAASGRQRQHERRRERATDRARRRRRRPPGTPAGGISDSVAPASSSLDTTDPAAVTSGLAPDDRIAIDGPFGADGTLLKPASVDTTVADGKDLMRTYRVRSGDTLTGIANQFDVSMMTVWWANHLKAKDALHIGQTLADPAGQRRGRHGRGEPTRSRASPRDTTPIRPTSSRSTSSTIPSSSSARR